MKRDDGVGPGLDDLLALALRDEDPGAEARSLPLETLVEAAVGHGIASLLHHHLSRRNSWGLWPAGLEEVLEKDAVLSALMAERRRQELVRVLGALEKAGVEVLLMKGTPLAYSHYPRPELCPSLDTDLLFPAGCRKDFERVLAEQGFEFVVEGKQQEAFRKRDVGGSWHNLDCHWSISGKTVATRDFPFEELFARSIAVPALGPSARSLGPVDALLLCGIHFAHHCGRERLRWFYDVRLLTQRMDEDALDRFVRLAKEKRATAVSSRILELTGERLGPVVSPLILERLRRGPQWLMRVREPSAAFLPGGFPLIFESLATMRNQDRWEERVRFLRELLLPAGHPTQPNHGRGRTWSFKVMTVTSRLWKGLVRYGIQRQPVRRGPPRA